MPRNDPAGEFERTERRKHCAHLKVIEGLTWEEAAKASGYNSAAAACTDVGRYLKKLRAQTDKELEGLVQQSDMRYDVMRRKAYGIMMSDHPMVQNGKIVKDAEGNPVKDIAPQLSALMTMLRIEKQWSELHGTEASKKLEIALESRGDVEASLVTEAILAAAQALNLEPAQRMLALEAAAARLEVVDAEVI